MKIKRYGSLEVYQQLGILQTLRPKKISFKYQAPEYRRQGDKIVLDTWIKPVAGKELLTIRN